MSDLERRDRLGPFDARLVVAGLDDRRDQARRTDAVGAHVHRLLAAVRPGHHRLHRLGVFGAEVEDVADLDPARGHLLVGGKRLRTCPASCISEVAA